MLFGIRIYGNPGTHRDAHEPHAITHALRPRRALALDVHVRQMDRKVHAEADQDDLRQARRPAQRLGSVRRTVPVAVRRTPLVGRRGSGALAPTRWERGGGSRTAAMDSPTPRSQLKYILHMPAHSRTRVRSLCALHKATQREQKAHTLVGSALLARGATATAAVRETHSSCHLMCNVPRTRILTVNSGRGV